MTLGQVLCSIETHPNIPSQRWWPDKIWRITIDAKYHMFSWKIWWGLLALWAYCCEGALLCMNPSCKVPMHTPTMQSYLPQERKTSFWNNLQGTSSFAPKWPPLKNYVRLLYIQSSYLHSYFWLFHRKSAWPGGGRKRSKLGPFSGIFSAMSIGLRGCWANQDPIP